MGCRICRCVSCVFAFFLLVEQLAFAADVAWIAHGEHVLMALTVSRATICLPMAAWWLQPFAVLRCQCSECACLGGLAQATVVSDERERAFRLRKDG